MLHAKNHLVKSVWHWRIKMLNFAAQANSLRIHLGGVPTTTKNILGNLPDLSHLWKKFSKNKHVTFFLKKYRFSFIWQSISSPNHIIISRHRHFNIFYQNPGAKNNLKRFFFHAQVRNVNCYSVTHESKGVIQGIERVYNCKKH